MNSMSSSLGIGGRGPWVTAFLDGKASPFGAIPQLPHGHRLRAQSAHAARKVTRRLVMSKRNRPRQPLWIIENVLTSDFCIPLKYKYKSALSPSVLHLLLTSRTAMTTYTALGKVTPPIIISDLIRSSKNRAVWLYSLTSYRIYFHQYLQHVIS